MKKTPAEWKRYYEKHRKDPAYQYRGPLGAEVLKNQTTFRLWSPVAEQVRLVTYDRGDGGEILFTADMDKGPEGVWTYTHPACLSGTYYLYQMQIEGEILESTDPYGKACGVNGRRSMVIDLKQTDPPGFAKEKAPDREAEDVIYELHVKEFSWDPSGGFLPEVRGTYRAFTQEDTHLNSDPKAEETGLSYLKKLGVNTLQIMPMYDYGSVDEAGEKDAFNWGYDPMHYNIPEGSYSTDPYHGEVRIREAKKMIAAMHRAGFRVIMDVVYNHTYCLDTCLQRTMPWYFYRLEKDGTVSNGSCCGNDIASERAMVRRYIEDSVLYWAREYHMDGFRFDLMGLLDTELMNEIREKLDALYGPGEKLIYGEPWAAGDTAMEKGSVQALKENEERLHPGIGMFGDDLRDGVKGSVFEELDAGFVNGKEDQEELIACAIRGFGRAASRWIAYVSCHDNLTLWDKLTCTTEDIELRKKQNCLAAAIYFTSLGRPFLLSGEEFLRTKEGEDNSYNAPITLNRLDWKLIRENADMVSYYQGLIGLRKHIPLLCSKEADACDHMEILHARGGVVCYTGELPGDADSFGGILVAYNSLEEDRAITLPGKLLKKPWQVLLKGTDSHLWENPLPIASTEKQPEKLCLPGCGCLILGIRG
ncbi:MAG: type I pullulanase [Lachnospiraceae bacterium]|nr:type I pullulanase [Lachnospiraceae bacterium]